MAERKRRVRDLSVRIAEMEEKLERLKMLKTIGDMKARFGRKRRRRS